jgi:hypothetical protein
MQKAFNSICFQVALLVVSFTSLYHHTIIKMASDWYNNDNYSHGFLVPAIAAYMIWQQREELKALDSHPSYWGLVFMLTGMAFFIFGNIGAELFTMRFSIIITIFGLTIFCPHFLFDINDSFTGNHMEPGSVSTPALCS